MEAFGGFAEPTGGVIWILFGTFTYCIGSGLIPVLNAEVFLLALSAIIPSYAAIPVVLAAGFGQMAAKSVIYYAGRGVLSLPLGRYQARLQAAAQKLHRSSLGPGGFVFLSSTTGIPPFTVVSILAGTMRIPIAVFLLPGLAGRLVRFGILVLFPQAAREIFR